MMTANDTERTAPRIHRAGADGLDLHQEAALLRRTVVEALYHYGGCLSVTEILLVLYRRVLCVNPDRPQHPLRDRLILSKGHAALALYALLNRLGYWAAPLSGYASFDSILEGHPDMTRVPGIDFSSGSLGQGLSVGVGMALALRDSGQSVWVVLGDGECQEGQVWEAAMLAARCGLDRVHAIVDCNRFQEWGWAPTTGEAHPAPVDQMAAKWRAFGWHVAECDGHDVQALEHTCAGVRAHRGQPSVVLAHTRKGKGVAMAEQEPTRFHCETVTPAEHASIMASLA